MKSRIESVTITFSKHEALSIINALQAATKDNLFKEMDVNDQGAMHLLDLLRNNFQNSKLGIHHVD